MFLYFLHWCINSCVEFYLYTLYGISIIEAPLLMDGKSVCPINFAVQKNSWHKNVYSVLIANKLVYNHVHNKYVMHFHVQDNERDTYRRWKEMMILHEK